MHGIPLRSKSAGFRFLTTERCQRIYNFNGNCWTHCRDLYAFVWIIPNPIWPTWRSIWPHSRRFNSNRYSCLRISWVGFRERSRDFDAVSLFSRYWCRRNYSRLARLDRRQYYISKSSNYARSIHWLHFDGPNFWTVIGRWVSSLAKLAGYVFCFLCLFLLSNDNFDCHCKSRRTVHFRR
jgi:hypothetical protein